LSVPTYLDRVTWTTGNTSGTNVYFKLLRPQLMNKQVSNTVGAFTHTARYGAPLYYLSNFFALWRGSFKLHIKVVKTMFHSGKLLITYTPIETTTITPSLPESIYSLREIVDIREQSEITLNLPYMLHRPYVGPDQNMGRLDVFILNDLRCPETVAQSVDLLFYITAGDDFEFQAPTSVKSIGGGIYTPQSNNTETIVHAGIANSAIKKCSTLNSELSVGEHFLSIKQLLNRNSLQQPLVTQTYPNQGVNLYPWFASGITNVPVTGALQFTPFSADIFSFLGPMFQYFRGKPRILFASETQGNIYASNTSDIFRVGTSTTYLTTTNNFGLNSVIAPGLVSTRLPTQTPIAAGTNAGLNYIHVPYYCKFPVSFVQVWSGNNINFFADETQPLSSVTISTAGAIGATAVFHRSFCDDFQLSFFIGCPGLYLSTT